jgi:hypothetical protein
MGRMYAEGVWGKQDEEKKIKGAEHIHHKTNHNTRFLPNNDGVINSELTEIDETCSTKKEKRDTKRFDNQHSKKKIA